MPNLAVPNLTSPSLTVTNLTIPSLTVPKLKKPLIAVVSDRFSHDGYIWAGVAEQYLSAALNVAGVIPLIVPSLHSAQLNEGLNLDDILDHVDGVLVTGAKSNVHPQNYGGNKNASVEEHGPFDETRDETSLSVIRAAINRNIPLLAICRGLQELNVALGGTLTHGVQNVEGRFDHRGGGNDRDERYKLKHSVNLNEHGCLSAIVGAKSMQVNSVHEEGIERLAQDLLCEAKAEDGTIEAVSVKGKNTFMLGVQWHPEYWVKTDAPSNKIFTTFGEAVREHQRARV